MQKPDCIALIKIPRLACVRSANSFVNPALSLRLKALHFAQKSSVHECPENATIELPHMSTATLAITPEVLRDHGLTAEEYDRIKSLLGGREPTFTELGI